MEAACPFEMLPAYQIYWGPILEYLSVYILRNEAVNSFRNRNIYVSNFTESTEQVAL